MVAKFVQPDSTTQTGPTYKGTIDAAVAVLAEQAAQFAVSAQDTPNLTVAMRAGRLFLADRTLVSVASQNSAALTAPAANPRNDIVYYDATTGAIGVATGAENAAPADPAIPVNKIPKARIRWTVGMASITNSVIDDLSPHAQSIDYLLQRANTWVGTQTFNSMAFNNPVSVQDALGITDFAFRHWNRAIAATAAFRINDIASYVVTSGSLTNTIFIACGIGDSGTYIGISAVGGSRWGINNPSKPETFNGICVGADKIVAVGVPDATDAYIVTSPIQVSPTWTERSCNRALALHDVAFGNGLYVAVGDADGTDAYIITSPDGVTWTERSNPKNIRLLGVRYLNGLWLAGGEYDGTDVYLITSLDGITWAESANPGTVNKSLKSFAYGAGLYVAAVLDNAGVQGMILTSPNGITWTLRSLPASAGGIGPRKVIYSSIYRRFVAVGDTVLGAPLVLASADGITWTNWSLSIEGLEASTLLTICESSRGVVAAGYENPDNNPSAYVLEKPSF